MKVKIKHRWDISEQEAKELQRKLAGLVKQEELKVGPKLVAGVDISYNVGSDLLFAGVVILSSDDFSVIEKTVAIKEVKFPYIPGLLSFRETPALIEAFRKIKNQPDVVFVDGQGIAHPRFFGIASHIGVIYDIPTIGVAKKLLVGEPDFIPEKQWEFSPIRFKGRIVGALLCTREGHKPVVVSVGHKINLIQAIDIVKKFTLGFRIPEPTRLAHIVVNEARKNYKNR